MRDSANLQLVRRAATQLGPLLGEVVFVGGSVTDLLLSDRAAPEVRPTRDVDVIIEVASWGAYERVASRLRQAGFREDQSEGAPICR